MTPLRALRSCIFLIGYAAITAIWGSLGIVCGWLMPYRWRFIFIVVIWTRLILTLLRWVCGIRAELTGQEHLPETPCVVLVRHESTWETLFLQGLFVPQTTVIKRELLWIPFFGWAYSLLRPIAIDRSDGHSALKTLVNLGCRRLQAGIWVLLFPEGTRLAPGAPGRFQRGGAMLAKAADVPVIVIAHNAGRCWPARRWLKHPGVIHIRISPPISTRGRPAREITTEAEAWMRSAMADLYPPRNSTG